MMRGLLENHFPEPFIMKTVPRAVGFVAAAFLAAACQPRPSASLSAPAPAAPPAPRAAASENDTALPAPPNPPASTLSLAPEALTDSVITTRIKAGILSDPGLAGADISVNTDRGVVTLTGSIKSREQAATASAHAQAQDGVMRVDNDLSVNIQ
jgi:BON domain